jgi:thiamine biosynthesis lipoprotein
MGCDVLVRGAGADARRAIEELFEEREQIFSRFRPGSELNHVNAAAGGLVRVSPAFAEILELAVAAADETDGLVDPTVGAAIAAAGYTRDFASLVPDSEPAREAAPASSRSIRLSGRFLRVPPSVRLDLNGIVKSRTVDDALALLRGDGFVSAGGDLAARGGATVGLPGGGAFHLTEGGVATSGSDRRRWLRGGELQHHLIDPRTGRPSSSRWLQVSACGKTCVAADVAAKAAFLLDGDGPAWLDEAGIPGRFVSVSGETVENAAWRRSLSREAVCT